MPHFGHKPEWDILNMTNYFNEISAMCAGGARADEHKKEAWARGLVTLLLWTNKKFFLRQVDDLAVRERCN
ncbi:hypothetical protein Q1M64_12965 (plasmid) [Sinorhizobium meliloti]|nr:hypothetical protein Q1M63_14375 [Sinorhizobium meliloti]WKL39816.1 hypothetical protein Q1M64_12965 [Sinorhizobium meliloti]